VTKPDQVLPASRQAMQGPQALPQPGTPVPSGPRSLDEIEADIEQARQRLAGTVDALLDRVSPRSVATRSVARLKERLLTEDGTPRPEVIGAAVGVAVVVGLLVWRSRRS
jgi:MYXO-CTERM domain-containing protein